MLLRPECQRASDWRKISLVEMDFHENVECFEVCALVIVKLFFIRDRDGRCYRWRCLDCSDDILSLN